MTERPLSITTQIATPIPAALVPAVPKSANDAHPVTESVDEEPYTIKCICDYSDDDGNTIYCEKCDTWQHIECFYPGQKEDASRPDFDHLCIDCHPRTLNGQHATERQRNQRQNKATGENGDKKTKRPPSKSHKKKPKPAELLVNGFHDHDAQKNTSPQDHHTHTKKPKGHRSSHSISHSKRSPPINSRPNTHAHPPSPAHTPPDLPQDFHVHTYSDSFLRLYDNDETAVADISDNQMENLSTTNSITSWLRDDNILTRDTGVSVEEKETVFKNSEPDERFEWSELKLETKTSTINNVSISWRLLITPHPLAKNVLIGELFGLVGFQKDYCQYEENGWAGTVHPRPFVFFHPDLPLCIDTRSKGSIMRYTRRSCRANATIDTYITGGMQYHFWLVSERPVASQEQITLPWDFRFPSDVKPRYRHLLNLRPDENNGPFDDSPITEIEYEQLSPMVTLVLSEHGGCACDLGNECAFARFHRNYHGRSQPQTNGMKSKKGRKPKQSHVSPTSTGHATNSRAASEGQHDHRDDDDSRSVSGSIRSKPHSRDLTPLHGVGIGESNGTNLDASDREKRKLAMLEDSFRKMEQGPPRKKKRASDGPPQNSTANLAATQKHRKPSIAPRASGPGNTNASRGRQYVDAGTSRRQSGSPYGNPSPKPTLPSHSVSRNESAQSVRRPSTPIKSTYADSSTQTDDVENAWWKESTPRSKRKIVCLAKRLLKNRHRIQTERESRVDVQMANTSNYENAQTSPVQVVDFGVHAIEDQNIPSSSNSKGRQMSVSSSTPSVDASTTSADINMTDSPTIMSSNSIKPPPPPWPGQSSNTGQCAPSPSQKSPDLRVQMPPSPTFTAPNLAGPLSGPVTPSSATAMTQSPFGSVQFIPAFPPAINGVGPSPVKTKKMSLSDYKASRMKRNDSVQHSNKSREGSSPILPPAVLKPSLPTTEETKTNGILAGSAIVDTPLEKANELLVAVFTTELASKINAPSEPLNGTL